MSSDVAAPAGGDDDRTGRIARSDLVVFDDDDVASHLSDDASAISAGTMKNSHDEEMYNGSTLRPGGVPREDGSLGRVEVEPSRRTNAQDDLPTSNAVGVVNTNTPTLNIVLKLDGSLLYPPKKAPVFRRHCDGRGTADILIRAHNGECKGECKGHGPLGGPEA
mgnify:CR=1 FL=1